MYSLKQQGLTLIAQLNDRQGTPYQHRDILPLFIHLLLIHLLLIHLPLIYT